MKFFILFILTVMIASACTQTKGNADLIRLINSKDMTQTEALEIIEEAYHYTETLQLDSINNQQVRSGVAYTYTFYKSGEAIVKIDCKIKAATYSGRSSYYLQDSIPYYIHGHMRDKDIASGRYTHQELFTYLDGKKVIKQLRKTGINQENRASDLSDIVSVDITNQIKQPELDAILRKEEVEVMLNIN